MMQCGQTVRGKCPYYIGSTVNRNRCATSSNPSSHLTLNDLKPKVSWSSIFGHNDKWCTVAKRSAISAPIVWVAIRNPYAASSNPPSYLTLDDLEPKMRRSCFENNDERHAGVKRPYHTSSNPSSHLTLSGLQNSIWRLIALSKFQMRAVSKLFDQYVSALTCTVVDVGWPHARIFTNWVDLERFSRSSTSQTAVMRTSNGQH